MHTLALPKSVLSFKLGLLRQLALSELAYLIKKKYSAMIYQKVLSRNVSHFIPDIYISIFFSIISMTSYRATRSDPAEVGDEFDRSGIACGWVRGVSEKHFIAGGAYFLFRKIPGLGTAHHSVAPQGLFVHYLDETRHVFPTFFLFFC